MTRLGSMFDWLEWDIDREMQRMTREFERFYRQAQEWSKQKPGPRIPLVWGYSLTQGPEGEPRLERFGNVPGLPAVEGAWEPSTSVQVDDKNHQVHITADLPGVEKKDLRVTVGDEGVVTLEAKGKERTYAKTVRAGMPLVPDSARARYNNGVLDLTIEQAKPAKPRGHEIRIE